MIFHGSSSEYTPGQVKRENYSLPLYAIPAVQETGQSRPNSRFERPVGLEFRPASSAYSTISSNITEYSGGLRDVSSMPPKRQLSEDSGQPTKHPKAEHPEDFSNQVKTKLKNSTRTGQACDRCKVRKIRCDGLAGGCSPCKLNHTDCFTTDRITGRATSRGYTEDLEQQNRELQHRVRELEQRLIDAGGDKSNGYHDGGYDAGRPPVPTWNAASPYAPQSNAAPHQQETNMFRAMPVFRAGFNGDNFLGVATGNSNLSSIKGTALSILGMEIDIADFECPDMDEPDRSSFHSALYNKSYQAFLQTTLNMNPRIEKEKVELPPRKDGLTYAEWYFRILNPYLPLLHKPTFMKTLVCWYDDPTFRPTVAEDVIVHMVFAIMFFQYAARNGEDVEQQAKFNRLSNMHYHYSLGLFYELGCSHTAQDVTALTMICCHLRNFPKPGASWILAQTTFSLAIELGLHRSAKKWASDTMLNPLEIEMRKRTFWAILAILVTLSGKLGRPMPLRMEDFDVEMPEPLDDELLSEAGLSTAVQGKCLHNVGLQAMKMLPLFMELYSTIYTVRRNPNTYISTINSLESKLRAWRDGLPAELVNGESGQNEQEGAIFALYTQIWYLEFRLLLRHPSVLMTNDQAFNAESMRICVESSRQMLSVVRQLQKYKSLDTTWYNTAVYVMAITTTLCSQFEKRDEISAADLAALKEEMDMWLEIMGEVGHLLGSGNRLREAIRRVSDSTLGLMSKSLPARQGSVSTGKLIEKPKSPTRRAPSDYPETGGYYDRNATSASGNSGSTYIPTNDQIGGHQPTSYPPSTQYPPQFDDNTPNNPYIPENPQGHYSSYPASTSVEQPFLDAVVSQAQSHTSPPAQWNRPWQQWTSTITENLDPQDSYSASALMQLGGRELVGDGSGRPPHGMADLVGVAQSGVNLDQGHGLVDGQAWPNLIFHIGQGGAGS